MVYSTCSILACENEDVVKKALSSENAEIVPIDFEGIMGVPITFMDKYNPDQFEIVGNEYTLNIPKGRGYINGQKQYSRIFIRNKKPQKP